MLKKNVPIKFVKQSNMKIVYDCVASGARSKEKIMVETRLSYTVVTAALNNLVFAGNLFRNGSPRAARYSITNDQETPEEPSPFANVSSIFQAFKP